MRRPKDSLVAQTVGGALLAGGSVVVLVAAALPDWRVFTCADRRRQLEAIAARRWGWTAQAVLFPAAFGMVAAGMATVATLEPLQSGARRLGRVAALLGAAATLLWLPISVERLRTGANVRALLGQPPHAVGSRTSPTFWPCSVCAMGAAGALGGVLAWSGIARRTGTVAAAIAGAAIAAMPLVGDWPPFATYLVVLPLGIGLFNGRRPRGVAEHAPASTSR